MLDVSDCRLLAIVLSCAGCSLTRPSVTECDTSSQCQAAFGVGFSCSGDGFCERADPNARCNLTYPDDLLLRPESYPNPIVFGALMDRSVNTQVMRENSIRLAATQVGEEGGLNDRTMGVVFCDISKNAKYDSLERGDAAVGSAKYLGGALGVPAIIGPSASTDTLDVFQALKGTGVLVISPSATSPALTGVDGAAPTDAKPGLLWRTAPPDTLQGKAMAKYLESQTPSVSNVEVINEAGAYGEGLTSVFLAAFGSTGAHVTTFATTSERDAAVVAAGNTSASWVIFISSQTPDASAFLNAAVQVTGYDSKNLFLTDSAANTDLLMNATGAASLFSRVHGSRPAVPSGQVYELFRASFNAAFQKEANDFSFIAHAYDAAWLVFYGSAWSATQVGGLSGIGIAKGLRQVSSGTSTTIVPSSWLGVVEKFRVAEGIDVAGASGDLDYDPDTEETSGPVEIWRISTSGQSIIGETTINP